MAMRPTIPVIMEVMSEVHVMEGGGGGDHDEEGFTMSVFKYPVEEEGEEKEGIDGEWESG